MMLALVSLSTAFVLVLTSLRIFEDKNQSHQYDFEGHAHLSSNNF